MRLVSFMVFDRPGFGAIEGDTIIQLDGVDPSIADLRALLPRIAEIKISDLVNAPRIPLGSVTLLPPIPNPSKVFCVAANFPEPPGSDKPQPEFPLLFTRVAEAQTGHGAPILKPAVSDRFDFEGEMAVVIGKAGHKIDRAEAMGHVAGYACFNDGSLRDWQKHSTQFTPGKNFYQSGGFGPWLVTPDELPALAKMRLETRVNGMTKQEVCLGDMIFDPAWLISYVSTFAPLLPGDVIATGTPTGFGVTRTPKEFLAVGDVVEVEITGLGVLSNEVRQDTDPRPPLFS